MKSIASVLVILLVCFVPRRLNDQGKNNMKPGRVSAGDFVLSASSVIDSNTNAVILTNPGITDFAGNTKCPYKCVIA